MSEETKTTQDTKAEVKGDEQVGKEESAKKIASAKQQKYFRTAKGKRRTHIAVPRGRAYIQSTLNNTIVSITDQNGNVLAWASAGNCGFRGPKKSTPYAAGKVVEKVLEKIDNLGMKELSVHVIGIGNGRDSALRSLNAKGLNIISIKETTPVPHNGCRPRRARRI
ncbi:30S ribosomal protein S11 [Patescibacteria group bacterium]|nr:30S ribosomal protein S11 [Patescibacteria group bacterium]MBU4453184.1 30S ribosomal protein S11 [Patescibacteria group bacterium]